MLAGAIQVNVEERVVNVTTTTVKRGARRLAGAMRLQGYMVSIYHNDFIRHNVTETRSAEGDIVGLNIILGYPVI